MNFKPIVIVKNRNELLHVNIDVISNWDDFDKLILFLKENYLAVVTDSLDGIDTRIWTFDVNGMQFKLFFDDFFGTELHALNEKSELIVEEIGRDLEERFRDAE
jgi:hypothetical protein